MKKRCLIVGGSVGVVMLLIFVSISSVASSQLTKMPIIDKYFSNQYEKNDCIKYDNWYPGEWLLEILNFIFFVIFFSLFQMPPIS